MGEGDTAAVRGISGRDQKPIVQSSHTELAPKGSFPVDIFAHRGMEVAPLAETLCYELKYPASHHDQGGLLLECYSTLLS